MPQVLTGARAVVGGGILAVLLLACFGARLARENRQRSLQSPDRNSP